jgi:hypothetical protein
VPGRHAILTWFTNSSCSRDAPIILSSSSVTALSSSSCTSTNPFNSSFPFHSSRVIDCNASGVLLSTWQSHTQRPACNARPTSVAFFSSNACHPHHNNSFSGPSAFFKLQCSAPPPPSSSRPPLPCPKDASGNICGGASLGSCSQLQLLGTATAVMSVCICSASARFNGGTCVSLSQHAADQHRINASFTEQQRQAGRLTAMSCQDTAKPVRCPDEAWVVAQRVGGCHTSMAACASSPAAFKSYLMTEAARCATSTSTPLFDHVIMRCVAPGTPKTPVFPCPTGSKRCFDGTCQASCSSSTAPACPSGSTGSFVCPGNAVYCAASLSDCSKQQPWNGCPFGLIECPARRGVCVSSLSACAAAPGP